MGASFTLESLNWESQILLWFEEETWTRKTPLGHLYYKMLVLEGFYPYARKNAFKIFYQAEALWDPVSQTENTCLFTLMRPAGPSCWFLRRGQWQDSWQEGRAVSVSLQSPWTKTGPLEKFPPRLWLSHKGELKSHLVFFNTLSLLILYPSPFSSLTKYPSGNNTHAERRPSFPCSGTIHTLYSSLKCLWFHSSASSKLHLLNIKLSSMSCAFFLSFLFFSPHLAFESFLKENVTFILYSTRSADQ